MNDGELLIGIMASLGRREYTIGKLLALARPFGVTSASLRTNVSRLKKKGVLISRRRDGNASYLFSAKGGAITANVALSFKEPDWSGWDKSFWGALWSLKARDKSGRYRITKKLSLHRFASLHPGFWIRPYNPRERLDRKLESIFRDTRCRIVRFYPVNPFTKAEAASLWDIADAHKTMKAALRLAGDTLANGGDLSPVDAFMQRLRTGERIVTALFKDPLLPRDLLPEDWPAAELRHLFVKFDAVMEKLSRPFWEDILFEKGPTSKAVRSEAMNKLERA